MVFSFFNLRGKSGKGRGESWDTSQPVSTVTFPIGHGKSQHVCHLSIAQAKQNRRTLKAPGTHAQNSSPSICENRTKPVPKFSYSLIYKDYGWVIHCKLHCTGLQEPVLVLLPALHGLGQITSHAISPNLSPFGF